MKNARNLLIAASLHDVRRFLDRDDPDHGFRSADWFKQNVGEVEKEYQLGLSEEDVKEIYYAIKFHASDYKEFIDLQTYNDFNTVIDLLKTADSLDRFRLPKLKWWINTKYLKIKPPPEIIAFSFKCFLYSEKLSLWGEGDIESIKKAINFIKDGK